jgi:zinc protease
MVDAGAISVPGDKTGLDGLLANLLRTGGAGSLSPMQVDEALETMAANLSVFSDSYATTFGLSMRSQDMEEGMAILAAILREPSFDPGRLTLARNQAIENIRRQDDQPNSVASRALMRAIYGDHPLGRTPTVETVSAVSRDDLNAFHQRFFHPDNLWIAISGDFDRKEVLALLERLFGDWTPGDYVRQEIPPVEARPQSMVLVAQKNIPQTTILLGELGIDKDDPDLHAVRVMNYILGGGGFNSRLMREIRSNRGLAYSVYSNYQIGRRLPGPFVAGTETKSDSTLFAVNLMREIIAGMQKEPVSRAELNLAKESLVNSFIFGFTNTHEIVTQQMRLDFYDYPEDFLQTYRERVAAVTIEDVQSAARKHLNPDRAKIVLVGDLSALDGDPEELGMPVRQVTETGEVE